MPTRTSSKKKPNIVSRIVSAFVPTDRGANWETAARAWTAVGLFLLPLVVVPWSSDAWELHKLGVLVLTVLGGWVCYVVAMLKRKSDRWAWHPLDILVLIFGLVATVSMATSVNWWVSFVGVPGWTSQSLIAIWSFVGLYFLVAKLFVTPADRRLVWFVLLGSLATSFALQMFQFANLSFLWAPLDSNRWISTLGNLNLHVSIIAAVFATAMLLFWSAEQEKWVKLMLAVGVLLSWLVLLFSGRAVAWAVFALGMVIVVFHQSREEKKVNVRLIMVVVGIAAIGLIAQLAHVAERSGLPAFRELTLDQSTTAAIAFSTVADRPAFGSGPATWYYDFVSHRPESFNQSAAWDLRFTQGGSAWLQSFATLGIGGTIILFGILALGAVMAWFGWRRTGDPFLLLTTFVGAVAILSGFVTIWSFTFLVMAWVGLGLARTTVADWSVIKRSALPAWSYTVIALGAVVSIVVLIPFVGAYVSDAVTYHAAQRVQSAATREQAIAEFRLALDWNGRNADAAKLLITTYADRINDLVDAKKNDQASALVAKLTSVVSVAMQRDPENPQIIEAANQALNALAYAIPDAITQAQTNFVALQALEPMSPIHDVGYGQTVMALVTKTDSYTPTVTEIDTALKKAVAVYHRALQKKPGYFQARYSLMQAYIQAEKYTEALAVFTDTPRLQAYEQAYVYMGAAKAYAGLKKPHEAGEAVVAAIQAYPSSASVYIAAADYYLEAKETAAAKEVLTLGQKVYPNDTDIADKLKTLDKK